MKKMMLAALAALAGVTAAPAWAASFVLDLTGTVASGSTAVVDSGGFRFTFFTIALAGFDPTTFEVGDQIAATVTLDQSLTVPVASVRNGVDLLLLNTSYPGVSTSATGTTALSDMGIPSLSGGNTSSSQDQIVNSLTNFGGSSFTFDFAQSDFTVDALGAASLATDTAYFRYITVDALPAAPIPEPASWAMMIAGFGMVGAAMRRRQGAARLSEMV